MSCCDTLGLLDMLRSYVPSVVHKPRMTLPFCGAAQTRLQVVTIS